MLQTHRPTTLLLSITIFILSTLLSYTYARRGALVRDGMSSKQAYDNPLLGKAGDITIDPDVVAITTRCSKWSLDPIDSNTLSSSTTTLNTKPQTEEEKSIIKQVLSKEMLSNSLQITFRSKTLGANGKRPNWMRASATLGNPSSLRSKPLRAVWTCSNADADTSMTYEELNKDGRVSRKEIGADVLINNSYEECLKRLYGKYVELEVLLPRTKAMIRGAPPPSVVYRVPIQGGSVNPLGMVSKSRATVTLYPKGRTLTAANASGPGAVNVKRDVAIPLGLSDVHVPLGPGLVDPSWAKGRKLFWKGRSVGLV